MSERKPRSQKEDQDEQLGFSFSLTEAFRGIATLFESSPNHPINSIKNEKTRKL